MTSRPRIPFRFDASSLVSLDTLQQQGITFREIPVGDKMLHIPQPSAPHVCTALQQREHTEAHTLLVRAAALLTVERSVLQAQMAGHRFSLTKQVRLEGIDQWLRMYGYLYPAAHTPDEKEP